MHYTLVVKVLEVVKIQLFFLTNKSSGAIIYVLLKFVKKKYVNLEHKGPKNVILVIHGSQKLFMQSSVEFRE